MASVTRAVLREAVRLVDEANRERLVAWEAVNISGFGNFLHRDKGSAHGPQSEDPRAGADRRVPGGDVPAFAASEGPGRCAAVGCRGGRMGDRVTGRHGAPCGPARVQIPMIAPATVRTARPGRGWRRCAPSIVMSYLQGGEGEDAVRQLVLGHRAEADRQHPLRLCS